MEEGRPIFLQIAEQLENSIIDGTLPEDGQVPAANDGVSFSIQENTIYGLLGRNGAGKTTLMRILTGHDFATSGHARMLGADPFENDAVLSRLCFVKESQKYPDNFRVRHVLRAA